MGRPRVFRVVDGVWCVHRVAYLSCSYVVDLPHGTYLLDAGIDATGRDMEAGLAAAGRRVGDVRAILLTHWHNDHSSGAAAIHRQSGCDVVYHRDAAPRMTRTEVARGLRGWLGRRIPGHGRLAPLRSLLELAPLHGVDASHHCSEGDVLFDDFEVWETPGHSAGHVSYRLRGAGVLFTGDALAVAGRSATFMSRLLTEDLEQARQSMLRCLAADVEALCPGHRYPLAAPERSALDALAAYLRRGGRWPLIGTGREPPGAHAT